MGREGMSQRVWRGQAIQSGQLEMLFQHSSNAACRETGSKSIQK
jgi:hypothetical protein